MPADLWEATERFYSALNAVLEGDAMPMFDLWSHADDVTYMSPFGELLMGWEPVRVSWQAQADQGLGGEVHPEGLREFASAGLGVVVGFERGHVEIEGRRRPVDIRATSVYRVENGGFAMIGHHTDPLV